MIGCLCIHGFTGGPYEVEPLKEYLLQRTNWYIEAPTLPGHGKELALDSVHYEEWIDKAEKEFLKINEKCDKVFIIGFSMGGMIAAYLAAKYKINRLVLLSPSRKYISIKQMGIDIVEFVKDGLNKQLSDNPLFQRYISKTGSVPVKATVEFLKCMKFTKPYLQQVSCPVLIAQGIQDGMVPYKAAYFLEEEIPSDTQVMFFHDSKHHICLGDDKDALNQAVYSFLRDEK
ncbi:alpha/beta hydrolase [Aquibacillus albus]|uniref:Esterase/lipase n=1 Tax=Aquibacillus albus TaxID=1168171 RepID=A0ABS2MZ53_9BACI|nr:alpha/beta fold hydrolase [Aquibacillus albus]MBM7571088.1 esterase/lipase [Aquibacillus albus]